MYVFPQTQKVWGQLWSGKPILSPLRKLKARAAVVQALQFECHAGILSRGDRGCGSQWASKPLPLRVLALEMLGEWKGLRLRLPSAFDFLTCGCASLRPGSVWGQECGERQRKCSCFTRGLAPVLSFLSLPFSLFLRFFCLQRVIFRFLGFSFSLICLLSSPTALKRHS